MRALVINFLSLDVLNLHPALYWGLAAVYFLIFVSAFMSVRSLAISTGAKVAWLLIIIVIPILGLAVYALRCIFKANWNAFKPLFQSRRIDPPHASAGKAA